VSDEGLPEEAFQRPVGEEPAPLRALLDSLGVRRGWGARLHAAKVHSCWEEIAGPALAAHTEPVRLAGGILVVRADSPAWATQVGYLAGELVERACAVLGQGQVRQVKVVSGRLASDR
jgi:predicted nucleic acid-binding Zn ribbon protein